MAWAPLSTALEAIADVRHGCFALYSFDGATLHIGSSTSSEALATRIEAVFDPSSHLIDRESVAMIELWPLPQLATSPDADADAIVARVEEALILRALHASAPKDPRIPFRDAAPETPIPESMIFSLAGPGTQP
jgi:hypothetical protein